MPDAQPIDDTRTWRMREFATQVGVTVRALRYYDRIGLLTPRRTPAGYRVYSQHDRERMTRILALTAVGVPLARIERLLDGSAAALAGALTRQRDVLQGRWRSLDAAIGALDDAVLEIRVANDVRAVTWRRLVEVAGDNVDWRAAFERLQEISDTHRKRWTPALRRQMGAEWEGLVADVHRALSSGTADKEAQQLAARWITMLRRLYGDDVPLSLFVIAGRHVHEWNPVFGKWPGFAFLADALAAHPGVNG